MLMTSPVLVHPNAGFTSGLDHEGLYYCTFLAAMVADHDNLRAAIAEISDTIASWESPGCETPEAAAARRIKLDRKLERLQRLWEQHTRKEDQLLFPTLANYYGDDRNPCPEYEAEHQEARRLLMSARTTLGLRPSSGGLRTESDDVHECPTNELLEALQYLGETMTKQESLLFPMTQTTLTERDMNGLEARMGGC